MSEDQIKKTRKRKPKQSTSANEIDNRLSQAIKERAFAMKKVASLIHWQARLQQLEQEIQSLIGIQRGGMIPPNSFSPTTMPPVQAGNYSPFAPVPPGVGSIPAKQPTPTTGNQADKVSTEGGLT